MLPFPIWPLAEHVSFGQNTFEGSIGSGVLFCISTSCQGSLIFSIPPPPHRLVGSYPKMDKKSIFYHRYPVAGFFILAYLISWLFWGTMIVAGISSSSHLGQLLWVVGAFGPPIAALIMAGRSGGKTEVRCLLEGLLRWRVPDTSPYESLRRWAVNVGKKLEVRNVSGRSRSCFTSFNGCFFAHIDGPPMLRIM
jgi:hypothetical protein